MLSSSLAKLLMTIARTTAATRTTTLPVAIISFLSSWLLPRPSTAVSTNSCCCPHRCCHRCHPLLPTSPSSIAIANHLLPSLPSLPLPRTAPSSTAITDYTNSMWSPVTTNLRGNMAQFLPFLVESFESGPELYLAVLKRTPHRASETVRYLRGTVSLPDLWRG